MNTQLFDMQTSAGDAWVSVRIRATTASFGALNSLATSYSPRTLQLVLRYRY